MHAGESGRPVDAGFGRRPRSEPGGVSTVQAPQPARLGSEASSHLGRLQRRYSAKLRTETAGDGACERGDFTMRCPTMLGVRCLIAVTLFIGMVSAAHSQQAVVVNGVALDAQTLDQLQAAYGQIAPGRYWYDPVSGLWGRERGPTAGQIMPGLRLGGRLQHNASGGGTGVIINGREIHPAELAQLQQLFGRVNPGRYWLNAQGIGGYEGGPPQFNLPAAAAQRSGRGGGGYNRSGPGGHLMSDGNCFGYMSPNGSTVMSGNC